MVLDHTLTFSMLIPLQYRSHSSLKHIHYKNKCESGDSETQFQIYLHTTSFFWIQ